jgi:hypothetical protein
MPNTVFNQPKLRRTIQGHKVYELNDGIQLSKLKRDPREWQHLRQFMSANKSTIEKHI